MKNAYIIVVIQTMNSAEIFSSDLSQSNGKWDTTKYLRLATIFQSKIQCEEILTEVIEPNDYRYAFRIDEILLN